MKKKENTHTHTVDTIHEVRAEALPRVRASCKTMVRCLFHFLFLLAYSSVVIPVKHMLTGSIYGITLVCLYKDLST